MSMPDCTVLACIDALLLANAEALDDKNMQAWLETFSTATEASYVCNSAESVNAGRSIALMLDDCRARLEDRVSFVNRIWQGTYQDYQTRHMVQRMRYTALGAGRYAVKTNFIIAFTPVDTGTAELLSTGVYQDTVVTSDSGAVLLSRLVITDTSYLPHYIVYPL